MSAHRAWPGIASLALAALASACGGGSDRCTPGAVRSCELSLEGGLAQSGTQACSASRAWSECVGAGACRDARGAAIAGYLRCGADTDCGPPGCGVCNAYSGVQNPLGLRVCYPFCNTAGDCAPASAATDVAPRCVLGQCILLCRASSACPHDTQCLPWSSAATAANYPGYDGLCE